MRSPHRVFTIAAMGLVTFPAASQDLSKAVTLELGVVPVASVLSALEAQTGVTFRVGGGVSKDVVFVSVKNVPAKEFMERLAAVDRAEWQKMDGGYRLTRSDSLIRQLEKEEAQLRGATYQKSVSRLAQALALDRPYSAGDAKTESSRSQQLIERVEQGMQDGNVVGPGLMPGVSKTPAARAIVSLLSRMSLAELGGIRPNSRAVYATNPTLMQRPLPGGSQEIVAQFLQEQKVYLEANKGATNVTAAGPGAVMVFEGSPGMAPNPNAGPPDKTLLVASRFGDRDTIMFVLSVYDANGNLLATGMLSLSGEPASSTTPAPSGAANSKQIALSALSKEIVQLLRGPGNSQGAGQTRVAIATSAVVASDEAGGQEEPIVFTMSSDEGAPQAKLSDGLRERVLHPEKFDPLGMLPNELFKAWAGSTSKNMLASLPDSLFVESVGAVSGDGFTLAGVHNQAKGPWDLEVLESDNWLTVRPKYPATAVNARVDRVALGKMLRALSANGRLTLDQRAEYAASQGDVSVPGGLDEAYLRWVNAAAADAELSSYFGGQREMLKLWGLLSLAQRQGLMRGQPLALSSFSPAQLKALDRIVWHSTDGPRIEGGGGGRGGRMFPMAGLATERTQVLPRGVPGGAFLACQATVEQAVYAMTADGTRSAVMSASDLARNRAMNERGANLPAFMNPPVKYERYRLAEQTNLNFRFALVQRVSMTRRLEDASLLQGPYVAYDQLPQEFRNRVEQNAARTRALLDGVRGGPGRRSGPSEAAP